MQNYKKINTFNGYMIAKNDVMSIPMDESNTDYQEYLAWLSEGNEPEIIDLTQ